MCPLAETYTLFWTAMFLYAVAAMVAARAFSARSAGVSRVRTAYLPVLIGGFLLQTMALFLRGQERGTLPVSNPFETLQVVAWALVGMNLVLRQLIEVRMLNVFSSALASIIMIASLLAPSWDRASENVPEGYASPWVKFHALVALVAYALFGVLAICSVMYLLQDRALRRKSGGVMFAMFPSIRKLESFSQQILAVGFSLLSLSVGIGVLNWLALPNHVGPTKLLVAVAVWLAYAALVWLRHGNRLARAGFARASAFLYLAVILSLWPLTQRTETPQPVESVAPAR